MDHSLDITNSLPDSLDITDSMIDSLSNLSKLPVDLFIQQLTYLPYDKVVEICQLNQRFHSYCTSYETKWKALIQNAFGSLPLYNEILKEIHRDLGAEKYNYLVYTQFTKYLDPVVQLLIYDRQNDKENFKKLYEKTDEISKLMFLYRKGDIYHFRLGDSTMRIAALWLLGKNEEMLQYARSLTDPDEMAFSKYFIRVVKGTAHQSDFNEIAIHFAEEGNLKGLKRIVKLGANINKIPIFIIQKSSVYPDIFDYLLKNRKFSSKERKEFKYLQVSKIF